MTIKAYASRTGTKRNLAALDAAGWGLLVSAYGVHRDEGFADIMLDNGAWSAYKSGKPWDASRFEALLAKFGDTSSQTVLPDIVMGGRASLELSLSWLDKVSGYVLIAAQDGMDHEFLRPHVGGRVGIAVGGSTLWKWETLSYWCELGRSSSCRVHVLRANSAQTAAWAKSCGAYSFDGSGPSRFEKHLYQVEVGRRAPAQMTMTAFHLPPPFTPRDTT